MKDVAESDNGLKVCIYGRGKTGKTRLACSFPKPLLLIGTEDGTKSVQGIPGIQFVRITSSGELTQIVHGLRDREKYRSAVLDTAGGFQDLILKETLGLEEVPVQKSWGMTERQTWGTVNLQFKERMRELIDLSEKCGINVAVIAHERNFNDEGTDGEVLTPVVGAALSPSSANWLNTACDYVCQAFIREQTKEVHSTVGQGKQAKTIVTKQKTGRAEYCLRTGPHAVFLTGFRLAPGITLPDLITDPSYDKIVNIINGGK